MLRGLEYLDGGVLQQFHFGRKVATVDVTGVVDQDVGVAGLFPDLREGVRDGFGQRQVKLHDCAVSALLVDGSLQRRRVGSITGGQHGQESFLGEFLGNGAADSPAHADGQFAVIELAAVDQLGVAAIRLPLGCRADDDGDRFSICVHVVFLSY